MGVASHAAQYISGHEGVPAGFAAGGVDLVNGGNGAAASSELQMLTSLSILPNSKEMLH
jgi:hypothetical protein